MFDIHRFTLYILAKKSRQKNNDAKSMTSADEIAIPYGSMGGTVYLPQKTKW